MGKNKAKIILIICFIVLLIGAVFYAMHEQKMKRNYLSLKEQYFIDFKTSLEQKQNQGFVDDDLQSKLDSMYAILTDYEKHH